MIVWWILHVLGLTLLGRCPSASARLDNAVLPERLIHAETSFFITVDETARLVCPFRKDKAVIYDWQKTYPIPDEYVAIYDSRFDGREESGRTLKINRVSYQDGGTYRCIAISGYGSVSADVHLVIKDRKGRPRLAMKRNNMDQLTLQKPKQLKPQPPQIRRVVPDEEKVFHPSGSSIQLQCIVEGVPAPEVYWEKDGFPVGTETVDRSGTKFTKVRSKAEDSGIYSCMAKNQFGMVQHSFAVEIVDRQPPKPKISKVLPFEPEVREGTSVTLQCFVEIGLYDATIQVNWLKLVEDPEESSLDNLRFEGKEYLMLQGSDSSDIADGHYLSKLPLGRVSPSQSGTYVCFAVSSPGYDKKEVELIVHPVRKGKGASSLVLLAVLGTLAALCTVIAGTCCLIRRKSRSERKQFCRRITQPEEDEVKPTSALRSRVEEQVQNTYTYLAVPKLQSDHIKAPPCAPPPSAATSRSCLTSQSLVGQYDLPGNYYDPPSGYRQPYNSSVSSLPSTVTDSYETQVEVESVRRGGQIINVRKSERLGRHSHVYI